MNNLKIDLTGKYVILDRKHYRGETDIERMFFCTGGFGCSPQTIGRAIFGHFTIDAEETRVEGYQVKRLATEAEVAQAKYPNPLTEEQKLQYKLDRLKKQKAEIEKRMIDIEEQLRGVKRRLLDVEEKLITDTESQLRVVKK